MVSSNGPQIEHRVERCRLPNVRHLQVQKLRQKINARIIEPPAALTLNYKKQRYQRRSRAVRRILGDVCLHLLDDGGRKFRDLFRIEHLIGVTCCGSSSHYLSISPSTISKLPI